jgi:hypothetical protein
MRTTDTAAWRRTLSSLAILTLVGVGCSSSPGGGHGDTGGDSGEDTGGKSGTPTGGKTGGTGGKTGSGGSMGTPDAGPEGGQGGSDIGGAGGSSTGGKTGTGGASGGSGGKGGSGGASGGSGGAAGGAGGSSSAPPAGATSFGKHVLTWYTFQDNTPVNSLFSGSGLLLNPYSSVAVPFRELKKNGGKLNYGDKIWIGFLAGRVMPNGMKHTGWVSVDDFCGDNMDDSYCYQKIGSDAVCKPATDPNCYPNVDLYLGDFTKTGMKASATGDCEGPAGSGQELTDVYTGGTPNFKIDYGGSRLGTGKCGDKAAARLEQKGVNTPGTSGCWGYDDQDSASDCAMCTAETCASK